MVSGHVGEGCPFWPYPRDKFSCPASFPAELFRWVGSLLSLDSDVSGSRSRRFAPAKPPQLPTASSLRTAFRSKHLPPCILPCAKWAGLKPGRTVFPGFSEKKVNVPPAGVLAQNWAIALTIPAGETLSAVRRL